MTTDTTEPEARRTHRAYWGAACTCVYGVRGADPRNTVVKAGSRDAAVDMLMDGDVIVVSDDGGRTWIAEGEAL